MATWYEEQHAWGVKALPSHTTKTTVEQWDKWLQDMKEWEAYCETNRPKRENHVNDQSFANELSAWNQMRSMDRPNEPGYYRAAND